MNASTGKLLRYLFLTIAVGWTLIIGLCYALNEDEAYFNKREIAEANLKCTAVGGQLIIQFGTKDEEIGKVIHVYCAGVGKPAGALL